MDRIETTSNESAHLKGDTFQRDSNTKISQDGQWENGHVKTSKILVHQIEANIDTSKVQKANKRVRQNELPTSSRVKSYNNLLNTPNVQ